MAELVHHVRCEWGDCDPAGIWFYPTLFRWLDATTHHLMHEIGVPAADMVAANGHFGIPVVETHAQFHNKADYYDAVEVHCVVAEVRPRRFRLEYRVLRPRADGAADLLATAYEVRVCVAKDGEGGIRAQELPAHVRAGLLRYRGAAAPDET